MNDSRFLEGIPAEPAPTPSRRVRKSTLVGIAIVGAITAGAFIPSAMAEPAEKNATPPAAQTDVSGPEAPQIGIDVNEGSNYHVLNSGVGGSTVFAQLRPTGQQPGWGGTVGVYAPGTIDAAALQAGQAITVQGHAAYYVEDMLLGTVAKPSLTTSDAGDPPAGGAPAVPLTLPSPPEGDPAVRLTPDGSPPAGGAPNVTLTLPKARGDVSMRVVAWLDASGAWVVVSGSLDRVDLERTAAAVRLTPGAKVKAPYRLGSVPTGLRLEYAQSSTAGAPETNSVISFVDATRPRWKGFEPSENGLDANLRIQVLPRSPYVDGHTAELGTPTRLAGHDTWYTTTNDKGLWIPEGGANLTANVGDCNVGITVKDKTAVPYAQLAQLFEATEFKNCKLPDTWVAPLP